MATHYSLSGKKRQTDKKSLELQKPALPADSVQLQVIYFYFKTINLIFHFKMNHFNFQTPLLISGLYTQHKDVLSDQ